MNFQAKTRYPMKIERYGSGRYKVRVTLPQKPPVRYGEKTFTVDAEYSHNEGTVNACATGEIHPDEIEALCDALRLAGAIASQTLSVD